MWYALMCTPGGLLMQRVVAYKFESWPLKYDKILVKIVEILMARLHGVATKYLANYLGWRRLMDRFNDLLC